MQLTAKFIALTIAVLAGAVLKVSATPTPLASAEGVIDTVVASTDAAADSAEPAPYIISHEAMLDWLATTDAELTFVGARPNPLSAQITTVTYCSNRVFNVCGGPCTVYTGGATCLHAPDTNCLAATNNVGFCAGSSCNGGCNQLSTCGVRLDNGFCFTPSTNSIVVPP